MSAANRGRRMVTITGLNRRDGRRRAARGSLRTHGPPARKERLSASNAAARGVTRVRQRCQYVREKGLHFCQHCCQSTILRVAQAPRRHDLNSRKGPLRPLSYLDVVIEMELGLYRELRKPQDVVRVAITQTTTC
jgi:hypothetical protein